ncbi:MAG: sigma 54-interacting transcriptional regulator [Myxococcota bacterium]
MAQVLIVDDQDRLAELCRRAIPEHTFRGPARGWAEASEELARGRTDVVLLDLHFDLPPEALLGVGPGCDLEAVRRRQGIEILGAIRRRWPALPVVLTTSREELSLEQVDGEEYTYFLDDDRVDAQALRAQLESILAVRRGDDADGPVYWGRSVVMSQIRRTLAILSRGRLPVVLSGPTGTGKSLLARHFVHAHSGRRGRFVAVDLSTLPRDLGAATLFGAVRGAYTGSVADRTGAFEAADGGTLFLDEVGNLSADAQKLLLTVLQEGFVTRIGDLKERPVDVKVVVATNDDLRARVADGSFRADLYTRLNPATAVTLPRLVDRNPDWARLVEFSVERALQGPTLRGQLEEHAARGSVGLRRVVVVAGGALPEPEPGVVVVLFPDRALRALSAHDWPGNQREFSMVVENAISFALAELAAVPPGERPDVVSIRSKLVRDLLDHAEDAPVGGGPRFSVTLRPQATLNRVATEVERQYFVELWRETGGDFGKMADRLLGDASQGRKVQLRFNQLGLKVRELRGGAP